VSRHGPVTPLRQAGALLKPPSALAEPGVVAKMMAVMAQMQAAA
jgi:hypothetical protein